MQGNQVTDNPGQFTIEDFRKLFDGLFRREPGQPVRIYTNLEGLYTYDYIFALESGMLSKHMTKQHARFVRLLGMGLHKAVDENGIVWMIGKVKGKGYYYTNLRQKAPTVRSGYRKDRFNEWERDLSLGVVPRHYFYLPEDREELSPYIIRYREKKEAKRTGIRRKGTLPPEMWPYYHGC